MKIDDLFVLRVQCFLHGLSLMVDFALHYHGDNNEERNDHRTEDGVDPYYYLGDSHLWSRIPSSLWQIDKRPERSGSPREIRNICCSV